MQVSQGFAEAVDVTVGAEIRRRREELDMSQAELARRMGEHGFAWHQTAVAKTERGQRPLKFSEAYAMTSVLALGKLSALFGAAQEEVEKALLWRVVEWGEQENERSLEEIRAVLGKEEFRTLLKEVRTREEENEWKRSPNAWLEYVARAFEETEQTADDDSEDQS